MTKVNLPPIPEKDHTPLINMLLKVIEDQQLAIEKLTNEVCGLKSEIKRLKKHKDKPKLRSSNLGESKDNKNSGRGKRGSGKRKKTQELSIHKVQVVKAENVPAGATFKGYQDYVVQDISINVINTKYQLEKWQLPNGGYLIGKLPQNVKGHHFGPELRSYILYQYHNQCTSQPLILEQLHEWGIDISSGQLNSLLTSNKDEFHKEKDEILKAGLSNSKYINVDDTGARHKGKNGYCTHVGNESFAWFCSSNSKSRVNFLDILCAGKSEYHLNNAALQYMREKKLPVTQLSLLSSEQQIFKDYKSWQAHLSKLNITRPKHCKIATEGSLLGCLKARGLHNNLVIVSDDAGQFNILQHALCWIHAERKINELIPLNTEHANAIDGIRRFFWMFYQDLQDYKKSPCKAKVQKLSDSFDALFSTETCFTTLNKVLGRLKKNKSELLLVLEHPDIPLHNNLSESDIREYVKRRKVSGGTRSDLGKRCRDTFTSLKKTCRKNGITFWSYLRDRIFGLGEIQPLSELIPQNTK